MNPTEVTTQFIANTSFEQIPSPVIAKAKACVLDCAGVMIAASRHPATNIIAEFIEEMGGRSQASIVGRGIRTSTCLAAFANGSMAHVLDYDDTSRSMRDGHPTAPVLPTVLALGEKTGTSGKRILEAYIIGSEVEMKIGSLVTPTHADRGWHTTGTLGTMGAAAAAAKILDLDINKTGMAIGIAISEAAGVSQNFGTMTKSFHAGAAAKHGIIAALLAKKGFTSAINALEGKLGFCGIFCGDKRCELGKISERLGNPYDFIFPGVDIKRYPCCSSAHCAIDAVLQLAQKHKFCSEKVENIRCGVSYKVPTVLIYPFPKTDLEAKSSMQFCLAVALVDKKVTVTEFTDSRLRDPRIQNLMKRIEMYVHPDLQTKESLTHEFTLVTVRLKDGTECSLKISKGQGSMSTPLREEEIVSKYKQCAQSLLNEDNIERSIRLIRNFENLDNVKELMRILSGLN